MDPAADEVKIVKFLGESRLGVVHLYTDGAARAGDVPVAKCKFCPLYTPMLGTKLCDGCYEIAARLATFLRGSPAARRFVKRLYNQADKATRGK